MIYLILFDVVLAVYTALLIIIAVRFEKAERKENNGNV